MTNDATSLNPANNVVIADILPAGVTYVPGSAQKTYLGTTVVTGTYTSGNLG